MLIQDESEYERWSGASRSELVFFLNSPWLLHTGVYRSLTASLTDTYMEDSGEGDNDDAQTLDQSFRTIDNATNNVAKFLLINGVPPTAYGSTIGLTLGGE